MLKALAALFAVLFALVAALTVTGIVVVAANSGVIQEIFADASPSVKEARDRRERELVNNLLEATRSGNPFAEAQARAALSKFQNGPSDDYECEAYDRQDKEHYPDSSPAIGTNPLPDWQPNNTAEYWNEQYRKAHLELQAYLKRPRAQQDPIRLAELQQQRSAALEELNNLRRVHTGW